MFSANPFQYFYKSKVHQKTATRNNTDLTVIDLPTTNKHHETLNFSAGRGYNENVSSPNINYRLFQHVCISISVSSGDPGDFVLSYTQSLVMVKFYVCTHDYVVVNPYRLRYKYLSCLFTT